jgi:chromosome segregation ATPase
LKGVGFGLLVLATLLAFWKWEGLSLFSLGLGMAATLSLFVLMPKEKPPINLWEGRFHEVEQKWAQDVAEQEAQHKKLHQKMVRAEERAASYQKLVHVHQEEIEKLKADHHYLSESLLQKERSLNALKVAHLQPDLFEAEKKRDDLAAQLLQKECEELRQKLALLEREAKEPFTLELEEENERLKAELMSLQQLVTELSLPDEC